jgi:hypothetical protein
MPPPPQIEVAQTVMTPAPPTIEPAELPVAKPAEVEAPAPQTQVIIPQPVESIDATRPVEIATPDDVLSDVNEPQPLVVATLATESKDILGLGSFFPMQDRGDARLSDQEVLVFKRWFEGLPEEEAALYGPIPEEDSCWQCWAIIYRPSRL